MADDAASTVVQVVHSGPKTPLKVPEVHSEGILIKNIILFLQSHKKRSSDKNFFFHFHTPFYKIGGVLFWQQNIISLKIG